MKDLVDLGRLGFVIDNIHRKDHTKAKKIFIRKNVAEALLNRRLLKKVMKSSRFESYLSEWWHWGFY